MVGVFLFGWHYVLRDVVCDEMCQLEKNAMQVADTETIFLKAQVELQEAIENKASKQAAFDAAYKNYLDLIAERESILGIASGTIQKEYPTWLLSYIEYPIPTYDPNSTWYVAFDGEVSLNKLRLMNIAYQIGGEDFVLTLHAENQTRDPTKQSDCYWPKCEGIESGKLREESYGLCQLNRKSYNGFINSEYFGNKEYQLIKCWNEYKKALNQGNIYTKFYGYAVRNNYRQYFIFLNP